MMNSTASRKKPTISQAVPMAVGLTFLVTGALLSIVSGVSLTNWWSLFILFPGLIFLATGAILAMILGGRNYGALLILGVGLVVSTVAVMFLLQVDWEKGWPLMLIVPGFAQFLLGTSDIEWPGFRQWVRMDLWIGADVLLLGLVFLVNAVSQNAVMNAWYPFHWWGLFILLPGLGAFYNAANAVRSGYDGRHLIVRSLAAFGLAASAVALATFLNAAWPPQVAAGLASAGIVFIL
jgi:hypothetical protein